MEDNVSNITRLILDEVKSDDNLVRFDYLKLFTKEAENFSKYMAESLIKWRCLNDEVKDNEKKAYVSAFVYMAINLNVLSFKLFLSGQEIASGNLFRQVIECIALALLTSEKNSNVLQRFTNDTYSSTNAIRDLLKNCKRLSLNKTALETLKDTQEFYHIFSHVSKMTLASIISFSKEGASYIGSTFDEGKIKEYKKAIKSRVELAETFPNFIDGTCQEV